MKKDVTCRHKVAAVELVSKWLQSSIPLVFVSADEGIIRAGCSAGQILKLAGGDKASEETQALAKKLLARETLDEDEAYQMGKRMFDMREPSTVLRCCVAVDCTPFDTGMNSTVRTLVLYTLEFNGII